MPFQRRTVLSYEPVRRQFVPGTLAMVATLSSCARHCTMQTGCGLGGAALLVLLWLPCSEPPTSDLTLPPTL
eukprot:8572586-Pyramimonas_sp.AAC.1